LCYNDGMYIPDWLGKILSDPVAIATLVLALVTAVLALAAFWAIWQNYKFRERDRKERLLNEIIEWADDINNASLTPDISLEIKQLEAREVNKILRYATSRSRAISIKTIASENFKKELLENVDAVINNIERFMCINQFKVQDTMPPKEGFPETVIQDIEREITEGKTVTKLWDECATKLSDSVDNLLIGANKIK